MTPHNKTALLPRWLRHGPPIETVWVQRPAGHSGTLHRHRQNHRAERIQDSCDHTNTCQVGPAARIPSTGIPSIPIALRATPTTGTRPAVSSLEACPTPAP
jgi:hypothetical protein